MPETEGARYDSIGVGYAGKRIPDPRIAAALHAQLGGARSILNIGAGTGSYEPRNATVIALEPSARMIGQRSPDAAPVVQGLAEALPFADSCFDLAMGILTLHHWQDWRLGVEEALRVAGGKLLFLTWTGFPEPFWLMEYFPEIEETDRNLFPTVTEFEEVAGRVEVIDIPIPHDCRDGFLCAYWRRPRAYLDEAVRRSISSFAALGNIERRLRRLEDDLDSGRWQRAHGGLLEQSARDYGYRLLRAGY